MSASLPAPRRRLRTKPAADYVGSTESTLNKRRVKGLPPAFIKLGKTVVYDTRDLDEWLASCRRQSTSELSTPGLSPRRRGSVATPRPAPPTPVGGLPGEALGHLLGSTLTASDVEKTATSDDRGGRPCVQKSR